MNGFHVTKTLSILVPLTFDTEPYVRHEIEIRIRTVDPHDGTRGEWSRPIMAYESEGKVT